MKRPGLLLFIIALLLITAGVLIFISVNSPRISERAKLVKGSMVKDFNPVKNALGNSQV